MIRYLAAAVLLAFAAVSDADCVVRARAVAYAPAYVAPTYQQAYPVAVAVHYSPDYYYTSASANKADRDERLAGKAALWDAYKRGEITLNEKEGDPFAKPRQKSTAAKSPKSAEGAKTDVPARLDKVVADSCLKCHGGASGKGGVDLSNLSTVPYEVRRECFLQTYSGAMPYKAKELDNPEVQLFAVWMDLAHPQEEFRKKAQAFAVQLSQQK